MEIDDIRKTNGLKWLVIVLSNLEERILTNFFKTLAFFSKVCIIIITPGDLPPSGRPEYFLTHFGVIFPRNCTEFDSFLFFK